MGKLQKKHAEKIRFILVGGFNTGLDFGLLFLLVALGVDKLVANFFSTTISMVLSFFLNKKYTFQDTGANARRQFALFFVVTLFGLWVLQPLVIWSVSALLTPYVANPDGILFIAKLLATCVSLVWNYVLYSRVVFKK